MSSVALFAWGFFVTAVAGGGIGLLVWGAIMDGREQRARTAAVIELSPAAHAVDDAA